MRMYDIISDKRNNKILTEEQIDFFINGVTDSSIPDYQISALLMAICLNGMNAKEARDLTIAMANSGDRADLSSINGVVVDKHSSGGVGDKCTLIIGPVVSSFGVPFAKLSGRGLGHTGGTIDKLESIEGFRTDLSTDEFIDNVNSINIAIAGQTGSLAPADKKLYALRDVTATVESIPLIAASIMSKKIASGADNILLDIKCGNGAFMADKESAGELAKLMSEIGKLAGVNVKVFITDMNQPLGYNIGNSLEIKEAIETLSGRGPEDLNEICVSLSAGMLELAGLGSYSECKIMAMKSLKDNSALTQFNKMVQAQGGKLSSDSYPVLYDNAKFVKEVYSESDGFITEFDTKNIGVSSLILGAGRISKADKIDLSAGIVLHKKINDSVRAGERLATFYTSSEDKYNEAKQLFIKSIKFDKEKTETHNLIFEIID